MEENSNQLEQPTLKEKVTSKNERIAELEVINKKLQMEIDELKTIVEDATKEADNDDF